MEDQNTDDTLVQWIILDAEYKRRIEAPDHYDMHFHVSRFVSQDDYNFYRELSLIKDEYFDWQAGQEKVMDYPAVIADKELRRKFMQIGRMLTFAERNLHETANEDSNISLIELFEMKRSSGTVLN
jgi:hypothetical protein